MGAGYDGSVRIDTRLDPAGFNKGVKSIGSSLKGLAGAIAVAFGTMAILNFGKTAVQSASDLASALTGLQSILNGQGKSFSQAQAFIEKYVADGLVPATNAINAYKNLSLTGFSSTQIEEMLTRIKDAASFGRQSALSMGQAIQSATEGIKNENSILVDNAGITKNLAKMWDEYAASIGKTANNLTQAEKNQATFNGVMQETRFQVGDAAKISQTYAGKVLALGASFEKFKVAVGNSIIPILSAIIPYIKMALDWLTSLFVTFAAFVSAFFGVDVSGTIAGYASETEALAGGTNEAAEAQGNLANQTTKAGKAAKGALAAFDELNVLQQAEPETPKTKGGGAGASIEPPNISKNMSEELQKRISEIQGQVEAFKKTMLEALAPVIASLQRLGQALEPLKAFVATALIDFYNRFLVPVGKWVLGEGLPRFIDAITNGLNQINWGAINQALRDLWDALAPFAVKIGEGLLWLWENVLVPLGTWVIGDALPVFLELAASGITVLTEALKALGPLADWLWKEFLQPIAAWTAQALLDTLKWLTERLKEVGQWIKENPAAFDTFVVAIGAFAAAWWLVNTAITAWTAISAIATTATTAFGAAVAFLTSPVFLVILAVTALIAILIWLIANWEEVKRTAGVVWDWIVDKWSVAAAWFKTNVTDPIARWFEQAWTNIKTFAETAWGNVKRIWGIVADWFKTNVTDPIKNAFETVLDWIGGKFETIFGGIKGFIKDALRTIVGVINGLLSALASGINFIVDALNTLKFTVPDWIPLIGGSTFGFDLAKVVAAQISVPGLATGAVVPAHANMLAMIGEGSKREVVAPDDLIRQIIKEELSGFGGQEVTINFAGSLGALVRELKPYVEKDNRRVGVSLISGASAI
jgi:hypothetical protein